MSSIATKANRDPITIPTMAPALSFEDDPELENAFKIVRSNGAEVCHSLTTLLPDEIAIGYGEAGTVILRDIEDELG